MNSFLISYSELQIVQAIYYPLFSKEYTIEDKQR